MDDDLDELERAIAAATEGPWDFGVAGAHCGDIWSTGTMPGGRSVATTWHYVDLYPADARAIVALRNAAPALIAELRSLRSRVAALRGAQEGVLRLLPWCEECGPAIRAAQKAMREAQ